jgi:O-acetyl-ADP-ribose deacetylase (regulator of RNase III)
MPAISAGTFGFPADVAADIALRTVAEHIRTSTTIERVTFVLRGAAHAALLRRLSSI